MMLEPITYSLVSAWVFAAILAWVGFLPRRADGRPALGTAIGTLFLISWAGGMWLGILLGFSAPHPLPFAFAALLAAVSLGTLAIPTRRRTPRGERARGEWQVVAIPTTRYWALMVAVGLAVVARYWAANLT